MNLFLKSLRRNLKKYHQERYAFFYFYFLRTPLVDSKYQWIGMKLMKVSN